MRMEATRLRDILNQKKQRGRTRTVSCLRVSKRNVKLVGFDLKHFAWQPHHLGFLRDRFDPDTDTDCRSIAVRFAARIAIRSAAPAKVSAATYRPLPAIVVQAPGMFRRCHWRAIFRAQA